MIVQSKHQLSELSSTTVPDLRSLVVNNGPRMKQREACRSIIRESLTLLERLSCPFLILPSLYLKVFVLVECILILVGMRGFLMLLFEGCEVHLKHFGFLNVISIHPVFFSNTSIHWQGAGC